MTLDPRLRSNPFATRFTRPGALPFLFPQEQTPQTLVDALAAAGWWGEIIGPHGSGKSSLLAALLPEIAARGRRAVHIALSQGERKLPSDPPGQAEWTQDTQVVVDGYEQLSWFSRRGLKARCRRQKSGLLITAHEPCGLPGLFQTAPSLELAQSIVRQLLPEGDETIALGEIRQAYEQQPGDLREMLFRLYDLYQNRQS